MEELLDYMQEVLGFSPRTRRRYVTSLSKYCKYHDMTLEELLEEAEEDEDNGVKKRKRRINHRLISFKKHMETTVYTNPVNDRTGSYEASTIKTTFSHIRAFYNAFDITVPQIRNMPVPKAEKYTDTITKEMIQEALSVTTNLRHRAIITAMAVSGLDGDSLRKLTWGDFLNATENYHKPYGSVKEQLTEIRSSKEPPIAMFQDVRGKTQYEHVFFFNPEAIEAIIVFGLSSKTELQEEDIIFQLSGVALSKVFARVNDKLGYGWTSRGTRRKFHAHGLRNYLGTILMGTTYDGMMLDSLMIEFMLGHSIPPVTAAYYKKNPQVLKDTYIKIMPKLSLEKVNIRDVDSPAYKKMEAELAQYKKLEDRINELERLNDIFSRKDDLVSREVSRLEPIF